MSIDVYLLLVFIIGYAFIVFEHNLGFDKAASALLTGVILWTILVLHGDAESVSHQFLHDYMPEIAGILLFLIGAMTIVEVIDQHEGFQVIANLVATTNKIKLVWMIGWITFFLSAVLDNLTTAIVMMSLLKKLLDDKEERMLFAGIVIIAANAGGAWTPMGDITTTMLWIGGQITTMSVMREIFLASVVCLLVPLIAVSFMLKGTITIKPDTEEYQNPKWVRVTILLLGICLLLFVPLFKTVTHLPPFMGMLLGLGILWLVTDILHKEKDDQSKKEVSVYKALSRIDVSSTLFFFGILSAVAALEQAELLKHLAASLDQSIGNSNLIVYCIGLLSAIIDNVPLVAATQGMYDYPQDHHLWHFIAYCAGTGGSILIIGSAAGVAVMGIEKINFIWYAKKIGWLAFIGYTAGALVSVLETSAG
jgi:Na+/H+ antiporter NhaD/arsenite permease-like protein